jgi:hypothetical protein
MGSSGSTVDGISAVNGHQASNRWIEPLLPKEGEDGQQSAIRILILRILRIREPPLEGAHFSVTRHLLRLRSSAREEGSSGML